MAPTANGADGREAERRNGEAPHHHDDHHTLFVRAGRPRVGRTADGAARVMSRFGFGQPVTRVEDPRFLTGRARYVDDVTLPRQAYAQIVRSPHAHARIAAIDGADAGKVPGVLAVLTGRDAVADRLGGLGARGVAPGWGGERAFWPLRPVLAADRARHVGDGVALVVAGTPDAARDAAERVRVEFDVLPAVTAPGAATAAGAPRLWDEAADNVGFAFRHGDRAAADAAFATARHVVRLSVVNNRLSANPLEPRGAIGDYHAADGSYTLYSSTQAPHRTREILADSVFRMAETRLRVIAGDVGGGFGMKGPAFPEEALVLWAARRVGRPVKWIAERGESLISDMHGRDQEWTGAMALDEDGRILAIRAAADFNLGAYVANTGHVPAILAAAILSNVYACPCFDVSVRGVFTNTPITGPYRGAGQPEGVYMVERLLDRAAAEIGVDPRELRRRNFIGPAAMPYRTALTETYDSGEFEAAMDKAVALADWPGFAARRAESEGRGRRRGIGLACFIEICALYNDRMEIRFDPGGGVTIVAGTFSHGQGHETVYAQMVSEWLGVAMDSIRLIQGDTDRVGFGRGTYASRSMTVGGSALRGAADAVIDKGRRIAAHLLEAADGDIAFADGVFSVAGTDRTVAIAAVARAAYAPMGLPPALGVGLEGVAGFSPEAPNYPNGCHICEVEIDPDTGRVTLERYAAVDDVGRAVNPLLLFGQVHGGVAQGIGQAALEAVVFDAASGQMLSGSFMDYAMPRADDLPAFAVGLHEVPCPGNPLGVKGAGEAGAVGAPAAVINAILDALRPLGVTDLAMPATPQRVWRAIRQAAEE